MANDDFNGAQQDGVGFYQVTQRDGRRCSAADAYLAQRPQNLTVLTNATATGLVIEGGRAAGVTYRHAGSEETARAEAEVILAAGAIGSPQLLNALRHRPGRPSARAGHLRDRGQPRGGREPGGPPLGSGAVVDSGPQGPVGELGHRRVRALDGDDKGPLTSNIAEAGGFARSDPRLAAPDLQWHVLPVGFREQGLADPARRAMTVLVTLVDVTSRGRLRLASRDPRHRPLIDPGYLTDVRDLGALAVGVRTARDYGTAAPLSRVCAEELAPGDSVHTDHEIRDYIRASLVTTYHPAGTCAMGGDSGRAASLDASVVDPMLRVRGVDGLRVVDASVMPALPRGNTNAPVDRDRRTGRRPDRGPRTARAGRPRRGRCPGAGGLAPAPGSAAARRLLSPAAPPGLVQPPVQHRDQPHEAVHVPSSRGGTSSCGSPAPSAAW